MADGARDEDQRAKSADEAALSARLKRLGEGLDRAGVTQPAGRQADTRGSSGSALARGLRLSAELVGGAIVGAGIGLGIDYLAGTRPWAFIVFVLLGFAGGVLTVMRSAGVLPENKIDAPPDRR